MPSPRRIPPLPLLRISASRRLTAVTLLLATLAGGLWAQDPRPGAEHPSSPVNVRQQQPAFYVRAEVNHPTRSYREGDSLSVKVACEVDAYVYVVYQQADGQTYQIFPNKLQPDNRLKARQAVLIPGDDDLFRWRIAAPFGQEKIAVIASLEPLEQLSLPELRSQQFNPVSRQQLKGVELELGRETPAAWTLYELEINTYPRSAELASSRTKRYGIFFGVAQYQFNTEYEVVNHGRPLNLPTCHRDARRLAEVLREVGELNDLRVYTNEEATRENLEQAVTQWLPSVSRPGDTVLIFFSGHGTQIPEERHGSTNRLEAALVPHDFLTLDVLGKLLDEAKENRLPPGSARRVAEAVEVVKRAGSLEKAGPALVRETGVSKHLFGHWLQRLDGRQIIVVLDACYCGGFGQEKDFFASSKPAAFDFLETEFARLKDLGQGETALLAACSAQETAAIREETDLSVMTYYLVEAIRGAGRQLTLKDAHQYCQRTMADYFAKTNAARRAAGKPPLDPHEPQVFDNGSRPVYLKP